MSRAVAIGLMVVATGCGRIDFDPLAGPLADASPDVATGACTNPECPTSGTFCDGFETDTSTFPGWTDVQVVNWGGGAVDPGSMALVSTPPPCHGVALETRVVGATQFVQLFEHLSPRANPTYARMMVYLPSTNPQPGADAFGFGDLTAQFVLFDIDGAGQVYISKSNGITVTATAPANSIQHDRWECVEMTIRFAPDASGSVTLLVNGTALIDVTGVTDPNSGTIDQLILGLSTGPGITGTTQMFFDDVVIAAQPIGC